MRGAVTLFDIDGPLGDLAHYTAPPTPGQTAVSFAYHNAHGDRAAEANASGTRTAAYTYDPFGAPLETPPADTTSERWTGQWDKKHDTTTNLIEMGARPYDPQIGRFLAIDPIEGGAVNHYDYALQDPVNNYDLNGEKVAGGPFGDRIGGSGIRPRAVQGTTVHRVIRDLTGKVVYRGRIDLSPTLSRIRDGIKYPHANDGGIFQNRPNRATGKPSLPTGVLYLE